MDNELPNKINEINNNFGDETCKINQNNESIDKIAEKLSDPKRRLCVDAKFSLHHVGYKRWEIISKNFGAELDVWKILFEMGNPNYNPKQIETNVMYYGEENYLSIRPELLSNGIVIGSIKKEHNVNTNSKIQRSTKKQINKAEKIRQENLLKKIRQDLDPILRAKTTILKAKFAESLIIKMMIVCKNLIQKFRTVDKELETKKKYVTSELTNTRNDLCDQIGELIIGFNKILLDKINNSNISKSCLNDLINWIEKAKQEIKFDVLSTIIKRPELIFKTTYDSVLSGESVNLYQSQREILDFITSHDKYLALVHTMFGSGKTTMILPICKWLATKKNNKTKLIYCCPNDIVILEVAHMAYGVGIAFAIVVYNSVQKKLEYKWSTFAEVTQTNQKDGVLYICDIYVARILLEERAKIITDRKKIIQINEDIQSNMTILLELKKGKNETILPYVPEYILMGDELTQNADSQEGFMVDSGFSITTELFIELMKISPCKIILMSSTLPTIDQLPKLYHSIANLHQGMVIRSFYSSEAKIGCSLISKSGIYYAPHFGMNTIADIKHLLSNIKTNPFIGRFYTIEILLDMIFQFQTLELSVPNLSTMFNNPKTVNQTNIQQIAYQMLEQLIQLGNDEIVEKACQTKNRTNINRGVNLSTILTSDALRFSKGCLIFSSNPVQTAMYVYQTNFNKFLDTNSTIPIFQQIKMDKILKKYQQELKLHKRDLDRLDKKMNNNKITGIQKDKLKTEKNKTDKSQLKSELQEESPSWNFPSQLQIFTPEHLEKVSKLFYQNQTVEKLISNIRPINPNDLPLESNVSYDILMMLASGIGIYSTITPELDEEYLKTVILLAKIGACPIIFSDGSIAYGTNLAVSNIIIIDEVFDKYSANNDEQPIKFPSELAESSIIDKHSIKTIFQMLGRAGRGNHLSYKADIYTTSENDNLINKIKSYIRGTLNEGKQDEILNIQRAYHSLWSEEDWGDW